MGDEIDWNDLITAGLLHDLGNVIKFDLDKFPELLGDELPRIDFWRAEQDKLIEKYGNDDHSATGKMLDELNVDPRIEHTIQTKSFGNIRDTAASNDWLSKILQYCDLRVAPNGVVDLDERFRDIEKRYDKYASRQDFSEMVAAAKHIENQVAQSINIKLEAIMNDESAAKHKDKLLAHTIRE